ncbi:MAG: NAD(P)H-hydrate dehydratase, partial [Planifilum fulgidum]
SWWREWLRPRSRWSHKGTYGHLLVVGGSRGMLGAAVLAGMAGLRIGAGLSTVAVPAGQEPILAAKVTDALVWGWPDDGEGRFAGDSARVLAERVDRFTAAAVGPGLGRFPGEGTWLRGVLETLPCPVVLDADGLNILAEHPDALRFRKGETILTPHPGEMARLAGTNTAGVESSRHVLAREWAKKTGCVVVLKGTHTIIAFPDGTQMVNPTGTPAMAKAGSGDVLSGVIGGLLARGIPAAAAAAMGVYLHGLAGELAVRTSEHSLLASEILSQLGTALSRLASDRARA